MDAGYEGHVGRALFLSQLKAERIEPFAAELKRAVEDGSWTGLLRERGVRRLSVFRHERLLFVYAEHTAPTGLTSVWSRSQTEQLDPWPGGPALGDPRYEWLMNDIFHDDEPGDDVPWRRPGYEPERRVGSLARLKPEMYASYVFLHYQLQEEKPRQFNKYYVIGSAEQLIFSYAEEPDTVEPPRAGLLDTDRTPGDWQAAMLPHFEPWTDTEEQERIWRKLEEVVSLEIRAE